MKRWVDSDGLSAEEAQARALLLEVPTPTTAPGARARVWARIERPQPRTAPLLRLGFAGAALGAVAVFFLLRPIEAPLEVVATNVPLVAVGQALSPGWRLTLSPGGHVQVADAADRWTFDRGATVSLIDRQPTRFHLLAGRAERRGLGRVTLEVPPYQVVAQGDFSVERVGATLSVEAHSGALTVRGPEGERTIAAGGRWRAGPEEAATEARSASVRTEVGSPPPAEVALAIDEPRGEVPAPAAPRRDAPSGPATSGSSAGTLAPPNPGPASSANASAEAHRPGRAGAERRSGRAAEQASPRVPPFTASPPGGVRPTPSTPEIPRLEPGTPDWAALYREAQETRERELAVRRFDAMAANDNAYAEIAGHQAARLVMQQDPARAIGRYEALLRRFPVGAYAPEGRLNLIECRLQTGDLSGAGRELEAFLARYPGSERTAELLRMKAALDARQKK